MSAETGSIGISASAVSSLESAAGSSSVAVLEAPSVGALSAGSESFAPSALELSTVGPNSLSSESLHNYPHENPFSLPEYRVDPQNISLDTTRKLPELAFNPELYGSVIGNLSAEEPAELKEAIFVEPTTEDVQFDLSLNLNQPAFIPSGKSPIFLSGIKENQRSEEERTTVERMRESIDFPSQVTIPQIPEETPSFVPQIEIIHSLPQEASFQAQIEESETVSEEISNESALMEALADLSTLNFPQKEEQEWANKLALAASQADTKTGPEPSLAYELAFGKVETTAKITEAEEADELDAVLDEAVTETTPNVETEEEAEATEEDLKKKQIPLPEDSWDRYEIVERDQTAQDVQERRKEVAEKAVASAVNQDGEFDAVVLRTSLNRLDDQTADERIRISEEKLEIPDITTQARASIDESQTASQALSEIEKVLAQNEASEHLHEVTSRQTLPFEKLDQGAQDVITSQRVDKVIRPLIWQPADKLPLKNPVEIERTKKAA